MPLAEGLLRIVTARIEAGPLAVARIGVGAAATVRALEGWRILDRVLAPASVRYPYFDWLPVPAAEAVPALAGVWLAAAGLFTLGLFTRTAGAVLVLAMVYVLALDQQTYSNHLYLLVLLVSLLVVGNAGAVRSLDARRRGERSEVPAWPATLLKLQVSIVYGFAAVSKLDLIYLSGAVLATDLRFGAWSVPVSWRTFWPMSLLSVAAILLELLVAFGLWSPRLRPAAVAVGIGFHLTALAVMIEPVQLLVFTLALVSVYPLFFARVRPGAGAPAEGPEEGRAAPGMVESYRSR